MKVIQQQKIQSGQRSWSLDWHPQGNILASTGSSKSFTLWSYSQNKLQKISNISTDHSKTIRCLKFSNKGDKIALASFDSTISVWIFNNQTKDYQVISTLQGHQNQVKCVSWSKDDKKIASCSRDKNIWIWDFDQISYDYVCDAVLQGHTQDVKFVDWFPNQQNKLVSASYDNTIRIWEGEDDDYVCRQVLEGHKSIVWNVQIFSNRLISVGQDCLVIQWIKTSEDKYDIQKVYQGLHVLPIYTIALFKQSYFISGSADNSISFTKIIKGQSQQQSEKQVNATPLFRTYHQSDVNCIKTNPKYQDIIASCSDDQSIKLWKILQN